MPNYGQNIDYRNVLVAESVLQLSAFEIKQIHKQRADPSGCAV
jgi:hypothetical protein